MSHRPALVGAPALVTLLLAAALLLADPGAARAGCDPGPLVVQVLGAGGAGGDPGKAGAGVLLWVDGRARVLVDAGGGVALRFAQAEAEVDDLDVVALTRLRVEHTAALPALLETGVVAGRSRELAIVGPRGDRAYPGPKAFLAGLYHRKRGLYRYRGGLLDGRDGTYRLTVTEVDPKTVEPLIVLGGDGGGGGLVVATLPVPGGGPPTLAWQVRTDRFRVAFGPDTSVQSEAFRAWAYAADLLVVTHLAQSTAPPSPSGDVGEPRAGPAAIGRLAAELRVRYVVLPRALGDAPGGATAAVETIAAVYDGTVLWADDLKCFEFQEELPPPETDAPPAELPPGAAPLPPTEGD